MLNNRLSNLVMKDTQIIIKFYSEQDKKNNIKMDLITAPNHKRYDLDYCVPVLFEIGKINGLFEKIELNISYIKREASKKRIKQHSLELFFSIHHILLATLFDELFKLINRIFMTGMADKDVNFSNTLNNRFVKGTKIEKILSIIYKKIKDIKFYRNQIVHDSDFDYMFNYFTPKILNYFQMSNIDGMREVDSYFFEYINKEMGFEVKQVCTKFNEEKEELKKNINMLCDELFAIYENNSYRLNELRRIKNLTTAST